MIPLVMNAKELHQMKNLLIKKISKVQEKLDYIFDYTIGTMIELPSAALNSGSIAEIADFFSFGTNDLTQTTLGLSRDDMGLFYDEYQKKEIYNQNPFASIDQSGVGKLMRLAACNGREVKPNLKLGICGEHAGEPSSIDFCHRL